MSMRELIKGPMKDFGARMQPVWLMHRMQLQRLNVSQRQKHGRLYSVPGAVRPLISHLLQHAEWISLLVPCALRLQERTGNAACFNHSHIGSNILDRQDMT